MSAGERVRRAAATVLAAWERGVEVDPQTDAARALDDAGMLLDPEVAAELAALRRAREESPLGSERMAEIRSLDLLVMMSDRSTAVVGRALGDLLTELERLRSRVAELEDAERQRVYCEKRHALVAGIEAAEMSESRTVRAGVGELREELAELDAEESAARLRSVLAPSVPVAQVEAEALDRMRAALPLEDPQDSPLHHDYRVSRDLPESGGAS